MGKLIVVEGLDGSGKGTQTHLLYERLTKENQCVKKISFPNYDSPASGPVKMYLAGEFGKTADEVNAYAASVLYAVDRFASYKTLWGSFYEHNGIVLSDRYTTSNAVHQCSKLPKDNWDEYIEWLFEIEYDKIGIPKPDLVIYLNVDPVVSQTLLLNRYKGNENKKDIHEKDIAYLQRSREAAIYCADKCGWNMINCSINNEMRPIEEISNEIYKMALNII